jgi:dipeptidyl aminopeptidase/acylaminoacyl peptidase
VRKNAPYGSWESRVTAELVSGKDRNLTPSIQADVASLRSDVEDLYFLEGRPDEGGRQVLMRRDSAGQVSEALPREFNVRTRYLEYGAECFLVSEGEIFFVQFADQQIYRCRAGESPVRLTNDPDSRFADLVVDKERGRLIALREKQAKPESRNTICAIDLATGEIRDLVAGRDFYNCPRISPDGKQLLWISWDHPNMPWNGTELWVGDIERETVSGKRKIAGDSSHCVCQAQWKGGNEIFFVAELGDWLNLFHYKDQRISPVYPAEAEFAYPDWTPGQKQYAFSGDTLCASFQEEGAGRLLLVEKGEARVLPDVFSAVWCVEPARSGFFAFVTFPQRSPALVHVSREGKITELYSSYKLALSAEEISLPEAVRFPTQDRAVGHAWFYGPKNSRFTGMPGEKPPLVVMCHGGPTAMSLGEFKKTVQFWTNRGYAVADVNYGGSTGYGRKYRERLAGNWGKVDVEDCVSVVSHLAKEGRIDPKRVAIRGGSAGGYTTLAVLTFTKGVISVGASYFGVSDLELLAKETHKLESRYLDQLVGPYPGAIELYKERSPLANTDRLACPIIFFQGDEDKVVPPNQSELMHESLKKKGIYSEYFLYPGEGHGFRKAETVQHSLKAEHAFYAKMFDFAVCAQDGVK